MISLCYLILCHALLAPCKLAKEAMHAQSPKADFHSIPPECVCSRKLDAGRRRYAVLKRKLETEFGQLDSLDAKVSSTSLGVDLKFHAADFRPSSHSMAMH